MCLPSTTSVSETNDFHGSLVCWVPDVPYLKTKGIFSCSGVFLFACFYCSSSSNYQDFHILQAIFQLTNQLSKNATDVQKSLKYSLAFIFLFGSHNIIQVYHNLK